MIDRWFLTCFIGLLYKDIGVIETKSCLLWAVLQIYRNKGKSGQLGLAKWGVW